MLVEARLGSVARLKHDGFIGLEVRVLPSQASLVCHALVAILLLLLFAAGFDSAGRAAGAARGGEVDDLVDYGADCGDAGGVD